MVRPLPSVDIDERQQQELSTYRQGASDMWEVVGRAQLQQPTNVVYNVTGGTNNFGGNQTIHANSNSESGATSENSRVLEALGDLEKKLEQVHSDVKVVKTLTVKKKVHLEM